MEYLLHVAVLAAIYIILAVSLDMIAGHNGMLSMAHAAFYGLGAYTSALMAIRLGAPFLVGVVIGMTVAAFASLVVSLPSLRVHDDYFVIATFAFQMIILSVFNNWASLTAGPMGIAGIPPPSILALTIRSRIGFLLLAAAFAGLTCFVVGTITASPFGRVQHALREDEIFAQSLGKNPIRFKVIAFAVSAAFAASAGSLYAHYMTYIDPTSFTVTESILVIAMVIAGGAGSRSGPLIGAILLVSLPEALRFLGLPNSVAANLRQIIYGGLLVVTMMFRPRGLIGKYGFGR
jgi:branched-chain amino acid transport system permease protein